MKLNINKSEFKFEEKIRYKIKNSIYDFGKNDENKKRIKKNEYK